MYWAAQERKLVMQTIDCYKTDIDELDLMSNLSLTFNIASLSNQTTTERIRLETFGIQVADTKMVYAPGKKGVRSVLEKIVLFALAFSAIPLAHGAGEGSTAGLATTSTCGISDGDKAFGIQVITDLTCATGGLGCYNDHCRYCKVVDTLKSAHLDSCTAFGASFPAPASERDEESKSNDVCTMKPSDGDAANGISIATDASCANGGLGCLNNICRFCKAKDTAQSAYLADCPTANNICTTTTSDGNAAVGIKIVTDTTCAQGGLGCIDKVCRFCRVTTTEQSAPYVDCAVIERPGTSTATSTIPAVTTSIPATSAPTIAMTQICTQTVSSGDAAVGINIVSDPSCASGGVGCIDQVCRFCKATNTAQSAAFVDCTTIAATTAVTTKAPTTPAPTAPSPVASTSPSSASNVCDIVAAAGDVAVGINVVTDTTCASGGLGCIDSVCRFCKVATTVQSAGYVDCTTITSKTSTTQAPKTLAPTTKPTSSSTTPSIAFVCTRTVSDGDKGVGLDIVSDVTCGDGGTGCVDDVCRFCKRFDTGQSQSYINCSSIPDSSIGADIAFVPIPVVDDSDTPEQQRVLISDNGDSTSNSTDAEERTKICSTEVSDGDAEVGISIITDTGCASGGLGCVDDICRLCKVKTTSQSAHLGSCSDYSSSSTPTVAAVTTGAPDAPTTAPASTTSSPAIQLQCYQTASSGDKQLGINLVTDIRCGDGGVGCVDSICRFCKLFETAQSHSFLSCSDVPPVDYGSDINFVRIEPVDGAQPHESGDVQTDGSTDFTTDPACADVELADGQAEGGIGVVLDTANCPQGLSAGCIGNSGCRYCKRFPTEISESLDYCAKVNTTDVAYALSGPIGERNRAVNNDAIATSEHTPSVRQGFFQSGAFQVGAVIVACIGVVAVIVLAGIGINRTVKTLTRSGEVSPRHGTEGDYDDEDEEKSSPTALVASNIGEPGVSAEV